MLKRTKVFCLLLLAFSLIAIPSTNAAVLLYQFRATGKVIGGGNEYRYSTHGYIVWDLSDNHLTWISYMASGGTKLYRVSEGTPIIATFSGPRGKRYATFSAANSDSGRYFQDFSRGSMVTLKHRTGETVQFPRTFKGLSHSFYAVGMTSRLDDNSHTMVYSQARTVAANDEDKTSAELVAEIVAALEADGYTEALPNPTPVITHGSSGVMLNDIPAIQIQINSTNTPPPATE